MGKLRKTIQRGVLDTLDQSSFTAEDFNVQFGDPDEDELIISIIFIHDDSFSFTLGKNVYGLGHEIIRSPGKINETEHVYKTFDTGLDLISEWCHEVRSELKASKPIYKEVDELRDLINEHLKSSVSDTDEFSVEEINNLRRSFEELKSRVERLEQDKIITEKQLQEFRSGINEVDEEIDFYPKKTWLKTASNKLVKIVALIGKSQEGRKMLADGARKLIGLE